jgi:hypothetical protein
VARFSWSDAASGWMLCTLLVGALESWELSAVVSVMVGSGVSVGLLYGASLLPCMRKWR